MPNTRCPTSVVTRCSTSSGRRRSMKHSANRPISPIARSVARNSSAPASDVIAPPSKPATTVRRSTGANSKSSGLHSVGIGALRESSESRCGTTTFADSAPRCAQLCEIFGLNHRWYEKTTGEVIKDVQSWVRNPVIRGMAATLDGIVEGSGAVFEAKFMLPWSFSEEAAAEKHMAQVQHNMWVANAVEAVLSIITGGGKWVEIKISADPLYQHLLLTAERKFWRCVESGEPPRLFGVEPPRVRIAAVRIVDMSSSNAWAEFSSVFRRTRDAYLEHENAKAKLKGLVPEDAKEAAGHGVRAKRSKTGAVSFDLLSLEGGSHA